MEAKKMPKKKNTLFAAIIGGAVILLILIAGTIWMGRAATNDTNEAVRNVSLLYLDELSGRREQVMASSLQNNIETVRIAADLMTDEDLSDEAHRQAYQKRMKALYHLDRFAFVGESGTIYLSTGPVNEIDQYSFDYKNMTEPNISIKNAKSQEKKAVIAVPIDPKRFEDDTLVICFMEIDMKQMLSGVSMTSGDDDITFVNLYTRDGIALSNAILGGMSDDETLFDALKKASFKYGGSAEQVKQDFTNEKKGDISFTYRNNQATLSYTPVTGTDWMLTYLVRENAINEGIGTVADGIIFRSVLQSILTVLALLAMFLFIILQNRKNAKVLLENEKREAEAKARQKEMEERLAMQDQLLQQREEGEQQKQMITSLSADYRSVYYLELDKNDGVCYQSRTDLPGFARGERFKYLEAVTDYCNAYVVEQFREEFLKFIQPEAIREGLKNSRVISYRYLINVGGKESWEVVKFAGVHHEDEEAQEINNVGACFADVDAETRASLEQTQTLSDALETAEQANKAKTAFLSNMSHEIRTPMNAIIGLDNIAINDPETPEKTREYLEKIGDSAEHLLNLINDILDMSRIESGKLVIRNEEFSFSKLLESINTMFSGQCADKGQDYQCHILGQVEDHYIGDNMKLRQVLINILGNAVKFTPEGGKVEMTVEQTAQFENQSTLQFTIRDTGIGISDEFLPHIFDTFAQEDSSTTNKYGSSGLGLAITKNIVEIMNGDIRVDSVQGEGTTFVVTVTLMNVADRNDEEDMEIHPHEMTVLIVDDDPIACEHAKLVLEKAGIASEIAECGEKAIEMVQLRHARRDPYNLILVDWQMPEMDGVETTRKMRALIGHESAIIILTAYRWDDVLEEATKAGVDSFIPKPLFANTVIEEFRTAVKRKSAKFLKENHKAELKGRRVLLAEDVQINAEIMMMVLQTREMEADLAVNGKIAVEKFESHESGYYDAILMDMRMPEMDGLEATKMIRAMDRSDAKTIPIIALTANAFDEDVQRSLQAGLNAHLSKPVQPEALYETMESLIKD